MINLISDTVTRPSTAMLEAMTHAEVGDDVFKEDPTINRFQEMVATMFGMEDALFCPSGTMTNQIAIKCHTNPMDELICDKLSHVYQSENGGYAYNSGIAINLIDGKNGKITAEEISSVIKPDYDWFPKSKLVVIENSCNIAGGTFYTFDEMRSISNFCRSRKLALHLDGARIFNVLAETNDSTREIGKLFDSMSLCMSKGLGAPVGSVLLGTTDFIKKARRIRKAMGGGMRQAGILAAACIYALVNNRERLKIDNDRAKELAITLSQCSFVDSIRPVQTNIVIFNVNQDLDGSTLLHKLKEKGINAAAFGSHTIRFVTHLDLSDADIQNTKNILLSM